MHCSFCETGPHAGGTYLNAAGAVGICQRCGAGVCLRHSMKGAAPGAPLLCSACDGLAGQRDSVPTRSSSELPDRSGRPRV